MLISAAWEILAFIIKSEIFTHIIAEDNAANRSLVDRDFDG